MALLNLQWLTPFLAIVEFDSKVVLMLPTHKDSTTRNDVIVDVGGEIKSSTIVAPGLHLHTVYILTQPRDRLQFSLMPFLEYASKFLTSRIELVIPLGNPLASFDYWFVNLNTNFRF